MFHPNSIIVLPLLSRSHNDWTQIKTNTRREKEGVTGGGGAKTLRGKARSVTLKIKHTHTHKRQWEN